MDTQQTGRTRWAKRSVRAVSSAVNAIVMVIVISLVMLSVYALWDSHLVEAGAASVNYAKYLPRHPDPSISFQQLQKINPEVTSWLQLYGTGVSYPVTQGHDNMKYLNYDAYGNYELSGSLYLDYRNSPHYTDFNSIIYGHHMAAHMMFGDLGEFTQKGYWDTHKYGDLYYDGTHHGVEVFAFAHVDAYDAAVYDPALKGVAAGQKWLGHLLSVAKFQRDIGLDVGRDHLLMMSTCNSDTTNGRDILLARIDAKTFKNTFKTGNAQAESGISQAVDGLVSIWRQFPQGTLVIVWPLFVLLLALPVFISDRRRRRSAQAVGSGTRAGRVAVSGDAGREKDFKESGWYEQE